MRFGLVSNKVIFYLGSEFFMAPALVVIEDECISEVIPLSEVASLDDYDMEVDDLGDLVIMAG